MLALLILLGSEFELVSPNARLRKTLKYEQKF